MQFWTNELIAVVIIAVIGIVLLAFLTVFLYASRGLVRETPGGDWHYSFLSRTYTQGTQMKQIAIVSILLAVLGAGGLIYFAQDLWSNPLYVNNHDLNLQLIFVVFAVMVFFISFSFVALRRVVWGMKR